MLLHAIILSLSFAQAARPSGVISGGGGGAFVCRNADRSVSKSMLLDFWEAREISGVNLQADNSAPVDVQFVRANERLAKIDSSLALRVKANYAFIRDNHVMAGPRVVIAVPNDANDRVHDSDCPLEGMMFFDDQRQKLIIKEEIFKRLETLSEVAAAYFHEALYKAMRDLDLPAARDSVQTRITVGCLFAKDEDGKKDSWQKCLGLRKMTLQHTNQTWQCEIPAGPGQPELKFLAFKNAADDDDWQIMPSRFGDARYEFDVMGRLAKLPVTLPPMGPVEPGTGMFKIDGDSFRIKGLEQWGLPWSSTVPPFGRAYIEITTTNPLTIRHSSQRSYQCKSVN